MQVSSWEEAIRIENANPYGNAACIYTERGADAEWFLKRFRASMLGVNVGIPVPREVRPRNTRHSQHRPSHSLNLFSDSLPLTPSLSLLAPPIPPPALQPFSFGGLYGTQSKYGDFDITGDGAMEFFSNRIKITSKWTASYASNANASMPKPAVAASVDKASFDGKM